MASLNERLILASASATRAHLVRAAGIDAAIEPVEIDEASIKQRFRARGGSARECALALAEAKAAAVSAHHPCAIVIGADQILICCEEWFDKPADLAAARCQLQVLRGNCHVLETAACAIKGGERLWMATAVPRLRTRDFIDQFLDGDLAQEGNAILGSVGAYRLEGRGVQLFERIEGDFFAILGLPMLPLIGFLRESGQLIR
jgi:nucleoside triphosphate pyrophosphatase